MADTHGNTPDPLIAELVEHACAFDFFRAVRLLECRQPKLPRVGFSISPTEDSVRFWQNPSLRFAPSNIEEVRSVGAGSVTRLAVNFFGLFGPNAPLPPHITEYVLERELHHHDPTITAFFNLFHHRLISLFYRAWAANQKVVDLDRPTDRRFAVYIGALFGIGMEALQERDAVSDTAKLFFAGRLACQTRNAEGLEAILREYFAIPSEVQPFTGRWLHLPKDSICRLGLSPESCSLGVNTILGERFWDCQMSFRMRFGPMGLADYERMLPQGDSFKRVKYWVLNYCGEHFFWDAQLVLRAEEVPPTRLGQTGPVALSLHDLIDLPSLAAKLSAESQPHSLSRYLWNQLLPATKDKLNNCTNSLSLQWKQAIVDDLNRIIQKSSLYEPERFAGVALSPETRKMVAQHPPALDLPRLNRRLLEDAYPLEISKHRQAGGLGWTTWLKTKSFAHDADELILNPPHD